MDRTDLQPGHGHDIAAAAPESGPALIPVFAFGASISLFLAITYLLCVLFGLISPDIGIHLVWFQFLPGFVWLTWPSFFLGLIEVIGYGWCIALVFGPLYNFAAARLGSAP